jgi:hypothetical protein
MIAMIFYDFICIAAVFVAGFVAGWARCDWKWRQATRPHLACKFPSPVTLSEQGAADGNP